MTVRAHSEESQATESGLTSRELDLIRILAQGKSNSEIAEELHLEPGTVKSHLTRINGKIGTRDRAQIIVWAFTHGVTRPQDVGR